MRVSPYLCLLLLLPCLHAPAAAQVDPDTSMARPGTRMRVADGEGAWRTGRFWYLRADTLWLIEPETDGRLAVPLAGGERIEITRGRRREAWSAGGALLGAALGVALSQLNGSENGNSGSARNASEAVLGGAGGAVLGGFLGWLAAPQRWHPVERPVFPPPPPSPEPGPEPPAGEPDRQPPPGDRT